MTGSNPGQPRGKNRARFAQGTGKYQLEAREYKVVVEYSEPTYASRQDGEPRTYHWTYFYQAHSPREAEELARKEFRKVERESSVGWARDIVKITTVEV